MEALERYLRQAQANAPGNLRRFAGGLAVFGKEVCVRAAIAAARAALEVWERLEPTLHAPHDRIAAAEAWVACPCDAHREAAGRLAWANGDDNPMKWTTLVVDGRSIEDMNAIYAHWASDNAASATWVDTAQLAAEICGTGLSAAAAALEGLGPSDARVVAAVVHALMGRAPTEGDRPFLHAIGRAPSDEASRAVYADWLEEQERHDEAAFLRLEAGSERERVFGFFVHPDVRRVLARVRIEGCRPPAGRVCPGRWDALTATGDPGQRICAICQEHISYARSREEAERLRQEGARAVVDIGVVSRPASP